MVLSLAEDLTQRIEMVEADQKQYPKSQVKPRSTTRRRDPITTEAVHKKDMGPNTDMLFVRCHFHRVSSSLTSFFFTENRASSHERSLEYSSYSG